MPWIPAFRIGALNAWIFMLYYPMHPLILILVDKAVGTGEIFRKMGGPAEGQGEKRTSTTYMVLVLALLVYSIFLPLNTGTGWFFEGLVIYVVGLVIFLASIINFATTPYGHIISHGMYRYSRHPLYLSILMTFVGVAVACSSWVFLVVTAVMIYLQVYQVKYEEQACLKVFGQEYQEYRIKTPRWIGIPK